MGELPEETVRELYTALPEQFTAARDAAAAAAKAAGHAAQATAVRKLRRPTVAAWMVNLLAHRAPARVAELAELADSLRIAQRALRGDELRALTVRRRELLSALADEAERLALDAQPGSSPAKLPRAEVEQTLAAALADEDVAAQVRTGTVTKAVSYTGFGALLPGGADGADLPDEPQPAGARPDAPGGVEARAGRTAATGTKVREGRPARAQRTSRTRTEVETGTSREAGAAPARPQVPAGLRRALASAQEAEERARDELAGARAAEQASGAEIAEIRAALATLEQRRDSAQREANRRRAARTAAERALAAAARRTAKAQAAIDARGG